MSSTETDEEMTSQLESERAALAGLDPRDPLRQRAVGRLQAAWDELRTALFVLGIDSLEAWIVGRVELEVLLKAMAWDHWCPHHRQRSWCPPPGAASLLAQAEGMVRAPRRNGVDPDARHPSR